jgi:hypothetical protein
MAFARKRKTKERKGNDGKRRRKMNGNNKYKKKHAHIQERTTEIVPYHNPSTTHTTTIIP